jgi:glucarate dehydratase
MQITAVRATPVNIPFRAPFRHRRWRAGRGSSASYTKTVVEVLTDEGLIGLGEAADGDASVLIERLGERLLGLDPFRLNECEGRCVPPAAYDQQINLLALRRAFGAIEMGLWDLRGKAESRPLYELLYGAVRREIPVTEYFSLRIGRDGEQGETTNAEVADYCARMREAHGSTAFEGKVAVRRPDIEVEMVREIRRAVGDDAVIRLDANGGWTVPTAREALARMDPYYVRSIEEPVMTFEEMARLRPSTAMSFSAHMPDLRRAVALGVPDALVLSVTESGGVRRTVEFVQACELMGVGFWFYSGDTGIATACYLHLSAAIEAIREPHQSLTRWQSDDVIAEGPLAAENGVVKVPEGPGLGVTLDRQALERCHQRYLDEGPFPSGEPSGAAPVGPFARF